MRKLTNHKSQNTFRLAVGVPKDQANETGKVHEWIKCPDCKSGIRWFESNLCLMTDFLLLLILTSCWCFGFRTLFQEGFLFHSLGDKLWAWSEFWSKPIFQCPPCMASIHGALAYIFFYDGYYGMSIFFLICLCGLNFLITQIIPE